MKKRKNVTQQQILKFFKELQEKYPKLSQCEVVRSEETKNRWNYYQFLDEEKKMVFEGYIPNAFIECLYAMEFGLFLNSTFEPKTH